MFGSQWYQRMPFRKSDGNAWWKLWKPSPCVKNARNQLSRAEFSVEYGPLAPQVRGGVDEERRVVDEDDPEEAAPEEAAERPPEERADERREPEADADAEERATSGAAT